MGSAGAALSRQSLPSARQCASDHQSPKLLGRVLHTRHLGFWASPLYCHKLLIHIQARDPENKFSSFSDHLTDHLPGSEEVSHRFQNDMAATPQLRGKIIQGARAPSGVTGLFHAG